MLKKLNETKRNDIEANYVTWSNQQHSVAVKYKFKFVSLMRLDGNVYSVHGASLYSPIIIIIKDSIAFHIQIII